MCVEAKEGFARRSLCGMRGIAKEGPPKLVENVRESEGGLRPPKLVADVRRSEGGLLALQDFGWVTPGLKPAPSLSR